MRYFVQLAFLFHLCLAPHLSAQSNVEQRLKEAVIKRLPEAFCIRGSVKDVEFVSFSYTAYTKRFYAEVFLHNLETLAKGSEGHLREWALKRAQELKPFLSSTDTSIYRYTVGCEMSFTHMRLDGTEKYRIVAMTEVFDASFNSTCDEGECWRRDNALQIKENF